MFTRIGATELLIIFAIIFLLFGPKNLPKLGKAISETFSSFKAGHKDSTTEASDDEKASQKDRASV